MSELDKTVSNDDESDNHQPGTSPAGLSSVFDLEIQDAANDGGLESRFRNIGRYELLNEIGRGGYGVVFRAVDRQLQREVAIKIARPEVAAELDGLRRFKKEARAAATLEHPGIVRVFDCGSIDSFHYYVMPYLPGGHLGHWYGNQCKPISENVIATLIRQIALALQHGHENGFIHRDVKPQNILMKQEPGDREAEPVLLDFGLCGDIDKTACTTGFLAGTPKYMSPEQAMFGKRRISPSSDIYSLGIVLYELLTGVTPYQPSSVADAVIQLHTRTITPPQTVRSEISKSMEAICLKCLRKDPDRRYQTAQALADDLGCFLDQRPISARAESVWERIDFAVRYGDWEPRLGWAIIALNVTTLLWAAIGAIAIGWRFSSFPSVSNGIGELLIFLVAIALPLHATGVYCGRRMVRRTAGYRRLAGFAVLSCIWAGMHWKQFSSNEVLLQIYEGQAFAQVMVFLLIASSFTLQTIMLGFGAWAAWCRDQELSAR